MFSPRSRFVQEVAGRRRRRAPEEGREGCETRRGATQSLGFTTLTNIGYRYLRKSVARRAYTYQQGLCLEGHAEEPNSRNPSRTKCASGEGSVTRVRASVRPSLSSDVPRRTPIIYVDGDHSRRGIMVAHLRESRCYPIVKVRRLRRLRAVQCQVLRRVRDRGVRPHPREVRSVPRPEARELAAR